MKNPATRHFTIYSDSLGRFIGDFDYLRYIYTYMIYSQEGNTMHISGNNLPADSMYVIVAGDGQWSALPCLLRDATPIQKAMADYYDHASPGDLIKAHNRFAYFSEDKKWVGDLTALRPGEGYFLRRLAPGDVKIRFFNNQSNSPKGGLTEKRSVSANGLAGEADLYANPNAATNMTMIAVVENNASSAASDKRPKNLRVYVNDELAAVATPIDSLYFLTIQSDQVGKLRFELNGETLIPVGIPGSPDSEIPYSADAHYGSLRKPIILTTQDSLLNTYKVLENDHVVIIRNGERYDVTGKKLNGKQ